jgi:hypothetical protein
VFALSKYFELLEEIRLRYQYLFNGLEFGGLLMHALQADLGAYKVESTSLDETLWFALVHYLRSASDGCALALCKTELQRGKVASGKP